MLTKRALLGEAGAEDALQEYYADTDKTDEQKRKLSVVAQAIDLFTDDILGDYYQQWINGYLDIPENGVDTSSLNNQYTNYTGFYRTASNGEPKCCKFTPTDRGMVLKAPDFTYSIEWEGIGMSETGRSFAPVGYYQYYNGSYRVGTRINVGATSDGAQSAYVYYIVNSTGLLASYSGRYYLGYTSGSNSQYFLWYCYLSTSTGLPVYDRGYMPNPFSWSDSSAQVVASWGSIVHVPDGILTQQPWDYFNTAFLPWVKNECDNLGFDYRLITPYPDGYTPPVDPTEPGQAPTIPVATIPYNPFYEIATETHTEIVEVTNESGEVVGTEIEVNAEGVTDAEGADEYQYEFKIPELPHFKIPDVQVPTNFEIGENLANVCGSIWNTIYNFLDESGFLAVVIPALTIGLLLFILRYLGG